MDYVQSAHQAIGPFALLIILAVVFALGWGGALWYRRNPSKAAIAKAILAQAEADARASVEEARQAAVKAAARAGASIAKRL